jgi:tetratricopeptide (TPR) repeat protein
MLETLRRYAQEQLLSAGELSDSRLLHAEHYLRRVVDLESLSETEYLEARSLAELDLDNFREAMRWACSTEADAGEAESRRLSLALLLPVKLGWFWASSGYVSEGRWWCEAAIERGQGSASPELAQCLGELAYLSSVQGHAESAVQAASSAVSIARDVPDADILAQALVRLGNARMNLNNLDAARGSFEEALRLLPPTRRDRRLVALANLAILEHMQGNYGRAEELWNQALEIGKDLGNVHRIADIRVNMVSLLARMGRVAEAHDQVLSLVADVLPLNDPGLTTDLADVYVEILVQLGQPLLGARVFGAALATRERHQLPHVDYQEAEVAATTAAAHALVSAADWEHHCQQGRGESLEDLLEQLSSGQSG